MKKNLVQINSKGMANNERVLELKEFLIRLNKDGVTEELKEEGMKIVQSINPLELSLAEQSLIEDGMDPHELRHLCDIHVEALGDELIKLKNNISEGHVLDTLLAEHDEITKLLEKLEQLNLKIQESEKVDEKLFKELEKVSQLIIDAEPHHEREEDVLFIELEKLGVTGPTRVMRMEHETLREKKQMINKMSKNYNKIDFKMVKARLDKVIKDLCYELKDHIFKENYILYPTAFDVIKSDEVWESMLKECDKIGYCPFTPNK